MCTFLGQNMTVLQFGPNLKFRKQKGLNSCIQIVHIFILTPCRRKMKFLAFRALGFDPPGTLVPSATMVMAVTWSLIPL